MDVLLKVLKNIEQLRTQREAEKITLNMPADGSTTSAGTTITPSTLAPVATAVASKEEAKPAASSIPLDASSKSAPREPLNWRKRPINESLEAQAKLTAIMVWLSISQKRYGLSADDLLVREKSFQTAFSCFCIDDVDAAICAYTLEHDDIPAVANILCILEPPPVMPNWAVYISIEKRREAGDPISDRDKEFCRICRQIEVDRVLQDKHRLLNLKHCQPMQLAYQPSDEDETA